MLSWRRTNEQDGSEDWWWGLIVALGGVHLLQKSPTERGESVNKLTKVESVTGWTWRVRCTRGVCLFGRCQSLLILIFPFPVSTGPSSTHSLHSFRCRARLIRFFPRFFYDSALIAFNLCEFYLMSLLSTVRLFTTAVSAFSAFMSGIAKWYN